MTVGRKCGPYYSVGRRILYDRKNVWPSKFRKDNTITTAEAVTVTAQIQDTYYGGQTDFTGTGA